MPSRETIFLALALTVMAAPCIAAGVLIVLAVRRRWRHAGAPLSRRYVWARRIVFALALSAILLTAYSFIEPYWLEVTHVRIPTAKLAGGSRPVRIAQISDLHCDSFARLEDRLPEVIAREKPDLIVFTGDTVNSTEGLPIFKRCMARLSPIAPTFAVLGNWDVNHWRKLDLFGGTGVRVLDGEAVALRVRGAEIRIGGAPVWDSWWGEYLFRDAPPNVFTLFLYHQPDGAGYAVRAKVDLILVGHTHGGQVLVPFYGSLARFARIEMKYVRGLFRIGDSWLYVNRGIGMEGGWCPRIRFGSRPEVTILDLVPHAR